MEYIKQFFEWLLKWLAGSKDLPPAVPPIEVPPVSSQPEPKVLRKGDIGLAVGMMQTRLNKLGYGPITVDDNFGDESESTLKIFQEANSVGMTGVLGPQTSAILYSDKAKGPIKLSGSVVAAAEIARIEAKKGLQWTASGGVNSEAEKYLKIVRTLIGMPSGRFPWCAGFIFWCMAKAGIDMSHLGTGAAYVPSWVAWAKKKGYWHPASEKSFNPRLGDVGINDWNDRGTEDPEHISFILSYWIFGRVQASDRFL